MQVKIIRYEPPIKALLLTFLFFFAPYLFAFRFFNIYVLTLLVCISLIFYIIVLIEYRKEGADLIINDKELIIRGQRIDFNDIICYNYIFEKKKKFDAISIPWEKEIKTFINIQMKKKNGYLIMVHHPSESDEILVNNLDNIFAKLNIKKNENQIIN